MIIKTDSIYKSNKMSSCEAWVEERPSGLIKRGTEAQALKAEVAKLENVP
jgi:hypothetical protein